jgi:hypothetical protein
MNLVLKRVPNQSVLVVKKGIFEECLLYTFRGTEYFMVNKKFIRIGGAYGEYWLTSSSDYKVAQWSKNNGAET